MAKITNHAPGMRGILMTDGTTTWLDAGASIDLDKKDIAALPDLGDPSKAKAADDADQVEALTQEIAMLKDDNAVLTKANADLIKQVESLTAPKK